MELHRKTLTAEGKKTGQPEGPSQKKEKKKG
jgi:hypothetical protein